MTTPSDDSPILGDPDSLVLGRPSDGFNFIKDPYDLHFLNESTINAISGAIAGVTAGVAVCPLDVVKTKQQAQSLARSMSAQGIVSQRGTAASSAKFVPKYNGLVGTFRTIVKEEGLRGLYRGLVPITIGYLPTWTIYFVVYERMKILTGQRLNQSPFLCQVISAVTAGGCSTLATNPIWVVKTRLMSQDSASAWNYSGTWDAFKTMYRTEGLQVFYSGLGPALLGLTHVAIQFPLYEKFKIMFGAKENEKQNFHSSSSIDNTGDSRDSALRPYAHASPRPDPLRILLASSLAKMCASTITYPHEVIRTRMQIQQRSSTVPFKYRGILPTIATIYREEGWRTFYSGLPTNMLRTVPAGAVTLLTFEMMSSYLKTK